MTGMQTGNNSPLANDSAARSGVVVVAGILLPAPSVLTGPSRCVGEDLPLSLCGQQR
jgi:hypothetical protein